MKPELLIEILKRALDEEMGLVIATNNPQLLSHKLHAITKQNQDFSELIITVPSLENTVMIVKRTVELDEYNGEENERP